MGFPELVAAADRAVQGNLGAVPITYAPSAGPPVELMGMFDEAFVMVDQVHGSIESTTPSVFVALADLPVDPDDDNPTITVGGKAYRVRERQRDPLGQSIRLLLHLAGA